MPASLPDKHRLSQPVAFWGIAAVFVLVFASTGAPSPLYSVLQQSWGFSSWMLTVAFSVYTVALLAALLTVGALSDYIGRRPVLISALSLFAVSMSLLAFAPDISWLIIARTVQGIATGVAAGALGSYITELAPASKSRLGPMIAGFAGQGGMAFGALVSGAAIQWAVDPIVPMYVIYCGLFLLGIIVVAIAPETSPGRPGALRSLAPKVGVPATARREFASIVPVVISVWMLGGFYMSLMPTVLSDLLGVNNSFLGGLLIAVLGCIGATVALMTGRLSSRATTLGGVSLIAAGTCILVVAFATQSVTMLAVATVVGGVGFGTGYSGAFRLLSPLSTGAERARTFSAVYAVSYLAYGIPVIVAGAFSDLVGLGLTMMVYGSLTVLIAAWGVVAQVRCALRGGREPKGSAAIADATGDTASVIGMTGPRLH